MKISVPLADLKKSFLVENKPYTDLISQHVYDASGIRCDVSQIDRALYDLAKSYVPSEDVLNIFKTGDVPFNMSVPRITLKDKYQELLVTAGMHHTMKYPYTWTLLCLYELAGIESIEVDVDTVARYEY